MKRLALMLLVTILAFALWACAADDRAADTDDAATSDASPAAGVRERPTAPTLNSPDSAGRVCEPVAPVAWPEPVFADPSVIAVDEDLYYNLNGQRFFPIGFYNTPTDEAGLQTFKDEGFNIALTGPGCCGGTSLQEQIDLLDLARDVGLMMVLRVWRPADQVLTRPEEDLAAELAARTGIGSLFGWYTFDEPGLNGEDPEVTARMHEVLMTYDSTHQDMLVEAPMGNLDKYVDDCSTFMVDPYPSNWIPLSYVKAVMQEAWEATEGTKPIVGVMQGFSWDWYEDRPGEEFHPNGEEVRNMAWQFIIQRARGLLPWTYAGDYSIHAQPEIWASYLANVAEMNALMRVLLTNDAEADLAPECPFPTQFDYLVKEEDTANWVLTVSTNERSMAVSLDLSAWGDSLCIVDFTTGEVFVQDDAGRISVDYAPLQVRILEVM